MGSAHNGNTAALDRQVVVAVELDAAIVARHERTALNDGVAAGKLLRQCKAAHALAHEEALVRHQHVRAIQRIAGRRRIRQAIVGVEVLPHRPAALLCVRVAVEGGHLQRHDRE